MVCAARSVPTKSVHQRPFTAFEVEGPLDFALTGVLAELLAPLAEAEISVFTLSTYDTDWILVPGRRRRRGPRRSGDDRATTVTAAVPAKPPQEEAADERHHPRRLPRRRRRRRPQVQRRQGRRAGRQRRPDLRLRHRLHRQPLQGQPGAVEPGGRQGRHRPRRRPQLRRRQLLHRPRGVPDHARGRRAGRRPPRHRRDRRRRLLDRADRADQRPRARCSHGVDAAYAALAADGGAARRRGDHDHRLGQQAGRRRGRRLVDRRDGQGRRHARARSWPRCSSSSPPTPSCRPPTSTRALRAATRVSFDRLDSDGCMSTNDTVTVHGQRRQRHHARRCRTSPTALTQLCTDLAMQLLARRRGRRPRHRDHHAQRRHRGRRRRGRPQRGPQQPVQGRGLRQGPQLGPGAGQHRHHAGGVRPGRPRRRDERRLGLQGLRARTRTRPRST